jgi:hypothetical protein
VGKQENKGFAVEVRTLADEVLSSAGQVVEKFASHRTIHQPQSAAPRYVVPGASPPPLYVVPGASPPPPYVVPGASPPGLRTYLIARYSRYRFDILLE